MSANLQEVIIAFGKGTLFTAVESVIVIVKGSYEVGQSTTNMDHIKAAKSPSPITSRVARESSLFTATSS